MGEKYFTVSYDDGLEQDRRIIALMERYGIRGTFNLSSGMFGKKSYIRRVGALSKGAAQKDSAHPEEYYDHFALSKSEAQRLYSHPNVEVASHGAHHLVQTDLSPEEAEEEITRDFTELSELFGYRIVGHAFPKDTYNQNVLDALKRNGALYARRVARFKEPKDFSFDRSSLILMPTCWQLDTYVKPLLQRFLDTPAGKDDMVFFMWGHGYELDYGTAQGSYDHLEELFKMVSKAGDVHCVTNRELYPDSPRNNK